MAEADSAKARRLHRAAGGRRLAAALRPQIPILARIAAADAAPLPIAAAGTTELAKKSWKPREQQQGRLLFEAVEPGARNGNRAPGRPVVSR